MNKSIEEFYTSWRSNLDTFLSGYIYDEKSQLKPTRAAFLTLQYYLTRLLDNRLEDINKIILLPGIRGVGKTTLLSQMYFFEKYIDAKHNKSLADNAPKLTHRIYISADRLSLDGFSLNDFLDFYETSIAGSFINTNSKTLILIDEIQYDEKWSLFLKLLYDKIKGHKNILIIATGSSALLLNKKNRDLIRRSTTEKIFPLKFVEYLRLRHNIFPQKGLSNEIKNAVFSSSSAQEMFSKLKEKEKNVFRFWEKIPQSDIAREDYFRTGAFPFSMGITNKSLAIDRIKDMLLANIVQRDLLSAGDFDSETLIKIPDFLYLLASSDEITTGKLSSALKLNERTLNKITDALLGAEIIFEALPYGRPYTQVKKSSKFLFITPNIRVSLLSGIIPTGLKGKFLEDYCSLIFAKELPNDVRFYYDYSSNGADFIARFANNTEIIIEVGFKKESVDQVKKTFRRIEKRAKYGIIIGSSSLELVDNKILKIPLKYFLLI